MIIYCMSCGERITLVNLIVQSNSSGDEMARFECSCSATSHWWLVRSARDIELAEESLHPVVVMPDPES